MGLPIIALYCSSADLYSFRHDVVNREVVQLLKDAREFWNPIISKGSVEEDERQQDAGMAQYSSTNPLLVDYLF